MNCRTGFGSDSKKRKILRATREEAVESHDCSCHVESRYIKENLLHKLNIFSVIWLKEKKKKSPYFFTLTKVLDSNNDLNT